jgi:hypothetical protein
MKIYIEHSSFGILSLQAAAIDTIASIKRELLNKLHFLIENQRLLCGDRTLQDKQRLIDYNIQDSSLLKLQLGDSIKLYVRNLGPTDFSLELLLLTLFKSSNKK